MPKIMIDVDKIDKSIIPLSNKALTQMNAVIGAASTVKLPSDGFNWGKVMSELQDCANDIRTFNKWIQNIRLTMGNSINNQMDELEKIAMEPVIKKEQM